MTILLLCALLFPPAAPIYSGVVRLEGSTYRVEVQAGVLRIFEGDQKRLEVRGQPPHALEGFVPLAGAQFLRSSEDPLPTAQERQFSKTGAPQYAEEKRDWKGILRLYRKPGSKDVWMVFSERGNAGEWQITWFPFALTVQ
jgi:hypothetical protein